MNDERDEATDAAMQREIEADTLYATHEATRDLRQRLAEVKAALESYKIKLSETSQFAVERINIIESLTRERDEAREEAKGWECGKANAEAEAKGQFNRARELLDQLAERDAHEQTKAELAKFTEHQMGPHEFTEGVYLDAIDKLKRGMTQLAPDGNSCAICEDSGHQAWECHHDPLVAMQLMWAYRCYHCGRIFWAGETAAEHFGPRESDITCYQKMQKRAEKAEAELAELRADLEDPYNAHYQRFRAEKAEAELAAVQAQLEWPW